MDDGLALALEVLEDRDAELLKEKEEEREGKKKREKEEVYS